MSLKDKKPQKKKWGDRRDAKWVKDVPGLNVVMANLFPNRTDCEVYLNQKLDVTEIMKFIDSKNTEEAAFKTTFFHCFVAMTARLLNERPYLNRFIQGRRIYERNEITVSFVAKRRFEDHSEEALMQYVAKGEDTLYDVSRMIVGDVHKMRKTDKKNGIDDVINKFSKLPRPLLMLSIRIVRWLDFWGWLPDAFTRGDSNCASVLLSNLGSIRCPAVYHHLNNYGTTSVLMTIGTIHDEKVQMPDGSEALRKMVDIGATLDERIADGFYFAKSLKLFQHICSHPELLDKPLMEESDYEFV